jgi:predicted DNA-binding transcriptional regulator AlpA
MTEKTVQLIQLSVKDLTDLISSCLASEVEKLGRVIQLNPIHQEEELLTREEVSKLLKLSYTTLWKHNKTGVLPAKKLGQKVFYLRADVMDKLNNVGLAI